MKQSRTITLPPDIWDYIDRNRGQMTRGAYVEYCVKNADKYEDPKAIIRRHGAVIGLMSDQVRAWVETTGEEDFKDAIRDLDSVLNSVQTIIDIAINNLK